MLVPKRFRIAFLRYADTLPARHGAYNVCWHIAWYGLTQAVSGVLAKAFAKDERQM